MKRYFILLLTLVMLLMTACAAGAGKMSLRPYDLSADEQMIVNLFDDEQSYKIYELKNAKPDLKIALKLYRLEGKAWVQGPGSEMPLKDERLLLAVGSDDLEDGLNVSMVSKDRSVSRSVLYLDQEFPLGTSTVTGFNNDNLSVNTNSVTPIWAAVVSTNVSIKIFDFDDFYNPQNISKDDNTEIYVLTIEFSPQE